MITMRSGTQIWLPSSTTPLQPEFSIRDEAVHATPCAAPAWDSTDAARRAGTQQAASAIITSSGGTIAKVNCVVRLNAVEKLEAISKASMQRAIQAPTRCP